MNSIKYYIVMICFALLFMKCSQPNESDHPVEKEQSLFPIPDSIIHKSNTLIISKVGQAFFNAYIKLDSSRSKFYLPDSFCIQHPSNCSEILLHPHYRIAYKFCFINDQDYQTYIDLVVDINGAAVSGSKPFGIPDCPDNNCWDYFRIIEKENAVEIAKQYGFEKGIKEWSVIFQYAEGSINRYVWSIQNTLTEDKSVSGQYKASGKALVIDAMDGSIIEIYVWMAMS